jgi:hypothetical protein
MLWRRVHYVSKRYQHLPGKLIKFYVKDYHSTFLGAYFCMKAGHTITFLGKNAAQRPNKLMILAWLNLNQWQILM